MAKVIGTDCDVCGNRVEGHSSVTIAVNLVEPSGRLYVKEGATEQVTPDVCMLCARKGFKVTLVEDKVHGLAVKVERAV